VGNCTPRTTGVLLPARLRYVSAAATSGAAPDCFLKSARSARERSSANCGDVLRGRGELDAVTVITGTHCDSYTRVIVVRLVGDFARVFAAAVRIGDLRCSQLRRFVHCGGEIGERSASGLD